LRRSTDDSVADVASAVFDQGGAAADITVTATGNNEYNGSGGFLLRFNNAAGSGSLRIYDVEVSVSS
jgi:hypothetical protein